MTILEQQIKEFEKTRKRAWIWAHENSRYTPEFVEWLATQIPVWVSVKEKPIPKMSDTDNEESAMLWVYSKSMGVTYGKYLHWSNHVSEVWYDHVTCTYMQDVTHYVETIYPEAPKES